MPVPFERFAIMKTPSSSHTPHGLGAAIHDTWITANVKSSLALARDTRGQDIHVKTHGGEVFLSGMVNSHRQRNEALQLARAVHGVVRVDASELAVSLSATDRPFEASSAEETADYQAYDKQQQRMEDRH
ncbi:Phospholipid-binding domain-containing protein [Azotobacter chroococcum NCIMB 8003]|jgi:hyperosmotically inducible protein|uniref:Phospholipid-binding domain-containing protein n=2 Tax=Azotobacter chroococcum TaxID=353 RepID=A0A0C4WHB6_9GAMM|nr:Phospholipid-binding domain-containing protein [Azotobacter chroococcum NCIMB 8003]